MKYPAVRIAIAEAPSNDSEALEIAAWIRSQADWIEKNYKEMADNFHFRFEREYKRTG